MEWRLTRIRMSHYGEYLAVAFAHRERYPFQGWVQAYRIDDDLNLEPVGIRYEVLEWLQGSELEPATVSPNGGYLLINHINRLYSSYICVNTAAGKSLWEKPGAAHNGCFSPDSAICVSTTTGSLNVRVAVDGSLLPGSDNTCREEYISAATPN